MGHCTALSFPDRHGTSLLVLILGDRSTGLAKTLSRPLWCPDAITALDAHSVHQVTDEAT